MIIGVVGAGGGVGTSTFGLLLSVAVREQPDEQTNRPSPNKRVPNKRVPNKPHRQADAPDAPAEVVLIEADCSGGVAGARFDLGVERGIGSWISGLATDSELPVTGFGKLGIEGLRILPGPVASADAERVLSPQAIDLMVRAMTADEDRWWIVDLGRGGSSVAPLAAAADAIVIVCPGAAEYVVRLPSLVAWARPATTVVMLAGSPTWPVDEIRGHCAADEILEGPRLTVSSGEVVDLIEGRRRRRSRAWAAALACRDTVIARCATTPTAQRIVS